MAITEIWIMSHRTVVEFNHDFAHMIRKHPERFLMALGVALNSGSQSNWQELHEFGVNYITDRHHSNKGAVVMDGFDKKWPLP